MKTIFIGLCCCLATTSALSTHLLGGYMQVKRTSGALTYEFTIRIYTDVVSGQTASAAQENITVCFGDGSESTDVPRISSTLISTHTGLSVYRATHTYNGTGSGAYTVRALLLNRSFGIRNVPGSVFLPFVLETTFSSNVVNPTTPTFSALTDRLTASVNQRVTYNFKATDAEGDSIAYSLVRVRNGQCNQASAAVTGYVFPNDVTRRGTFRIDSRSGQLTWDAPTETGVYDFAVVASEWRNGQRISETLIDMLTTVDDKAGTPGTIPPYEPVLERDVLTGLGEPIDEQGLVLLVYPTPSREYVQVLLRGQKPTTARLQVVDLQGRILQETALGTAALEHEKTLGINQLAPGTYLIKAWVNGQPHLRKILKQ